MEKRRDKVLWRKEASPIFCLSEFFFDCFSKVRSHCQIRNGQFLFSTVFYRKLFFWQDLNSFQKKALNMPGTRSESKWWIFYFFRFLVPKGMSVYTLTKPSLVQRSSFYYLQAFISVWWSLTACLNTYSYTEGTGYGESFFPPNELAHIYAAKNLQF